MGFLYVLILVLGLVFGSFIAAISYRIPRNINFVNDRSFCPKCKKQISWKDNVPLVSYILLRGRCRNCHKVISLRYPFIEILSGAGFLTIAIQTLPDLIKTIYLLTIFVLLLTIFVVDLENQIIPDQLVYFMIGVTFLFAVVFYESNIFANFISGLIASSFLLIINLITKGKGMGLGDVKFAIAGGMFVGIKLMPIWLLLSFLTGALSGSILILAGRAKMKTKISFGPFLIIGLLLAVIFGDKILQFII